MTFGSFLGSFIPYNGILLSFIVHVSGQTRSYAIYAKGFGFSNNYHHFVLICNLVHCKIRPFFKNLYYFFLIQFFFFLWDMLHNSIENMHNKFKKEILKFVDFVRILLVGCFFFDNPVLKKSLVLPCGDWTPLVHCD